MLAWQFPLQKLTEKRRVSPSPSRGGRNRRPPSWGKGQGAWETIQCPMPNAQCPRNPTAATAWDELKSSLQQRKRVLSRGKKEHKLCATMSDGLRYTNQSDLETKKRERSYFGIAMILLSRSPKECEAQLLGIRGDAA
jgi:hypothetical protein